MSDSRALRGVEILLLTLIFAVASERLLQEIPGLNAYSVIVNGAVRLTLYAIACVAFGYWLARRLSPDLVAAGVGIGLGIALAFLHRYFVGDVDRPTRSDDIVFDAALFLANWAAVFVGAFWSRLRRRP